jgi:hypothetical protein
MQEDKTRKEDKITQHNTIKAKQDNTRRDNTRHDKKKSNARLQGKARQDTTAQLKTKETSKTRRQGSKS